MEFDLSKIEISYVDRKKGLVLPKSPSKELAEFIGILAGDGYVSFNTGRHAISILGDSRYDFTYLRDYVRPLIKKLFNLDAKVTKRNGKNLTEILFESNGVISFLRELGYYKHHSRNIKIPNWIMGNQDYFLCTMRGLADTDFSLMLYKNRKLYPYYPIIAITSMDKQLILLMSNFLEQLGFNVDLITDAKRFDGRFNKTWLEQRIRLSGRQNLELWMRLIGFRNQRHLNRYTEYLKSGTITMKRGRPQLQIERLKIEKMGPVELSA